MRRRYTPIGLYLSANIGLGLGSVFRLSIHLYIPTWVVYVYYSSKFKLKQTSLCKHKLTCPASQPANVAKEDN